jgi:hypothetical protein
MYGVIMEQNIIGTEDAKTASILELFQELSSSEKGLAESEAKKRVEQYGPNDR